MEIDAIILSNLDIKNTLKSFASCFLFSYIGSCSTSRPKNNCKVANFLQLQFSSTHSQCIFHDFLISTVCIYALLFSFVSNSKSRRQKIVSDIYNVFILSGRKEPKIFSSNLRYISHASSIVESTSNFKHNNLKTLQSETSSSLFTSKCVDIFVDLHCWAKSK